LVENLICLCANCHQRADSEKWGEKALLEYKRLPWIKRRFVEAALSKSNQNPNASLLAESVDDPRLRLLIERVRQVFYEHGLEPTYLARFLQVRKAPFSIALTDLQTDAALGHWLNDERKIDWISKNFLIRREWIDGEDGGIHEEFCFHKQPEQFFATVSEQAGSVVREEVHWIPEAHFLRWGLGKDWKRKGEGGVFLILAIPLARFSNDRIIYRYISDLQPYPWEDYVCNIEIRAWARLLTVNELFHRFYQEIPYEVGEQVNSNRIFLREVIEKHSRRTRDEWCPEDYAVYPEESRACKEPENLGPVVEFLRKHNLPWENTHSIFPKRAGQTGGSNQ